MKIKNVKHIQQLFTLALLALTTSALAMGERDVVNPIIGDQLIPARLTHQEMAGGELDRRITDLINKNYMVLDLDRDWLDKFKHRTDRGDKTCVYYGIGKVLDAGSLFAQYTGEPKVAERAQYIMDQLRSSRDPDGYQGFWNVEPNNHQNVVNWILHEQEYLNLALVRNYRVTGNAQALADAKIMANYIMRMFPANEKGENIIPAGTSIAGITESFVELYRVTGENTYLDFAKHLQYEPHWYYLKPYDAWEKNIAQARYHVYVMLSHMYPDTELYRLIGGEDYLKKSLWMKQELLEQGRGGLLVTGSTSQGEHFTYNQDGEGQVEESCVTAYLLRWVDSLMRLEGDMRYGDIMERAIYNALFGAQSPDGRHICYFTPFTGKRKFQTIDTFCCNGNFRRAVAELPQKVYYRTPDGGIALNLFSRSDKTFEVKGKTVEIKQETDYPNSGEIKLSFTCSEPVEFAFLFRTPRWAESMTCTVCNEPCSPNKSELGYAMVKRVWKSGDTLTLSMPMNWRFVRGRMLQEERVALLRGPVLFTFSDNLNTAVLAKCPNPRDLVLDPTSIGTPVLDNRIRPDGQKVVVKAWTNPERTGDRVDVVLTEFVDPDGIGVYFKVPTLENTQPIRIMDDELLTEPRKSANGEITFAWYGPKGAHDWKNMFALNGEPIADLAADYQNPKGKLDLPAAFPDTSKSGSWSLFNCRNKGLLSTAQEANRTQLNSSFKVFGCPLGYAYGLQGGNAFGFFANYDPAPTMEAEWEQHFSKNMFDKVIPLNERKQYLLTHPISDTASYNVIRWSPGPQLSSKGIVISGKTLSNGGGNGVSVKAFNWKDDRTPVVLNVLDLESEGTEKRTRNAEFFIRVNPGDLGKNVDIVIGTEIGGGWLLGSTDSSHRTFHRGGSGAVAGTTITDPIQNATYSSNPNAVFRRNGRPINALTTGYSGNWDMMTVHDSTKFQGIAGLACDLIGSASDRDGHQLIAEFIAYNRELSDVEIKQTEKYLYKKWFAGRTELRIVGSKNKTTINVEAPIDGDSDTHVNRFYGRGGLVKKGPGTLYLDRPFETVGPFAINEGTLAIANTNDWHTSVGVTPQLPDAGDACLAHFDASDLAHFTLDGNDRVLEWFDADGRAGVSAYVTEIASRPPVLRRDAMNGNPVVDLGRLNGNSFLEFRNGITTARSALMVCNARFGGSFVFSVTNNVNPDYVHRGSSTSAMWSGYDTMCPLFSANNKNVWLDGLEVTPTRGTFSGAPQILAINFTGNANIGRFGRDRSFADRTGGNQLAEILIYNRVLTDEEIMNAEAYLRAKWFPSERPVLKTVRAEGDGTLRAEKDLSIGTLGGTGKLDLTGGSKVTVKGIGNNFAVKLGSTEGVWDIRHDRGAAPTNLTVTTGLLAWFDPSEASTVTTNTAGGVTGFIARNNAELTSSVAYSTYYPTYMPGALNGKNVIDCGSIYSTMGLIWSESFTNAHTVICVYGSQGGGGQLFGSASVSQAFVRDIGAASNAVLTSPQSGLLMVDAWIDGVQADAYSDGFNGGYQIVSIVSPTDFNINAMGYRQSGSSNGGGQRYGEVLVYNTILSETQREEVEAYLAAKWFNTPIHGYTLEGRPNIPGLEMDSNVEALVIGEGETTSIGWRMGDGGVRKEGAGTLELAGSTTAFEGLIDVAEGTVRYTTEKYTLAVPEISGLQRRYDASAANAFEKDLSGNVTTWYDTNGSNPARLYFTSRVATERTDELNGLSVLDLGPFGSSGAGLLFDGELSGVRSVFMVLGSQAGGGFILGDTNNVGNSSYWHRENASCPLESALFGNCSLGYANGGQAWIDGTKSSPTAAGVLSGGYQLLEIFPSGPCLVDGFAFDRTFSDRTGGQRLGEVLFFDRTLSDTERIQVEAYLGYKWFDRFSGNADAMPTNLAHAGTVSVASGATFDLNGFTQTTASLAGGGTISGGDVKVTDAITVEGLTLSGDLTLGAGVTMTVTPGSSVTVTGTLLIGESGTLVLDASTVQPGTYKLFSSGSLSGAANLKNWTGQGKIDNTQYYIKLFASGSDVYMTVAGTGTLLMLL